MREYLINIDLYCYRRENAPQSYRLYVDSDLITERTYVWVNDPGTGEPGQIVKENVWVNLEPGEHEVKIEPVKPAQTTKFYFKNLQVDTVPVEHVNGKFIVS